MWLLGKRDANNLPSPSWTRAGHAEHGIMSCGIFLWAAEVHCPCCVPSQSSLHLQPACWGTEGKPWGCVGISLQQRKHWWVIHKCKAQHSPGCYKVKANIYNFVNSIFFEQSINMANTEAICHNFMVSLCSWNTISEMCIMFTTFQYGDVKKEVFWERC